MQHIFYEDDRIYESMRKYIKNNHPQLLRWLGNNYRHRPRGYFTDVGYVHDKWEADKGYINEAMAFLFGAIIEGSIIVRGFDRLKYGDIKKFKELGLLPEEYFLQEFISVFSDNDIIQEGFFDILKELYKTRFENRGRNLIDVLGGYANNELETVVKIRKRF